MSKATQLAEERMADGFGVKSEGGDLVKITLSHGARGLFVYLDDREARDFCDTIREAFDDH